MLPESSGVYVFKSRILEETIRTTAQTTREAAIALCFAYRAGVVIPSHDHVT